MSSADLATVVIACPNCGTRYQVPYGTLGAAGREVQCAQCGKPWHATADAPVLAVVPPAPVPVDPDMMFTPEDEAALDRHFESEAKSVAVATRPPLSPAAEEGKAKTLAEIRAAIAPRPRPAKKPSGADPALAKVQRSFDRRQKETIRSLPLARLRRTARVATIGLLLALLVGGVLARVELVRTFPSLAGLYAMVGLPVNVIGLEFSEAKTLKTLREGKTVMTINAKIRSVAGKPVPVPPVLVSLLSDKGASLYEWTAAPAAASMEPGEVLAFSTEVNSPPDGATRVRLSFTTPRGSGG
jgi:predicted Zn finger-like uncharacterized protein